jgi:hypothetical protein
VESDRPAFLVAHSGAGALLPAIRKLGFPAAGYLFADAGIPLDGDSRLDAIEREGGGWAREFRAHLEAGGSYPSWDEEELAETIPDPRRRRALVADLRPRGRSFWQEPIPVPRRWPDAPCAYLRWSPVYDGAAADAERRGWPVLRRDAGHFQLLVDPPQVADDLLALVADL